MSKEISLLCVHGVIHSEIDAEFRPSWTEAITRAVQSCDPDLQPTIDFLEYDELLTRRRSTCSPMAWHWRSC